MAYILCLTNTDERQEVENRILQYVISEDKETRGSTLLDIPKLSKDSVLNSALYEALRLQMNALTPRSVEEDTTLSVNGRSYFLRKGETALMPMVGVHKNPEIFDDPHTFHLKRFVYVHDSANNDVYKSQKAFTKSGVKVRNPYVWWGGGHHVVGPFICCH